MIIDKIENALCYTTIVKNLDKAVAFIGGDYSLPLGRHEFDGGAVLSSEITSLPIGDKEFEAHRNFADVMFVLEGEETVSYCPIDELEVTKEYDSTADCGFWGGKDKDIIVTVPAGYFYIVMPGEGHKPCVHLDAPKQTRKYILKCRQVD